MNPARTTETKTQCEWMWAVYSTWMESLPQSLKWSKSVLLRWRDPVPPAYTERLTAITFRLKLLRNSILSQMVRCGWCGHPFLIFCFRPFEHLTHNLSAPFSWIIVMTSLYTCHKAYWQWLGIIFDLEQFLYFVSLFLSLLLMCWMSTCLPL